MLGAFALGGAIGPVLYGLSFDLLNSYEPALQVSALVMLAAAVGLQTLGKYQYPGAVRLPVDSSPPTRRG
jgi:cyanate permease